MLNEGSAYYRSYVRGGKTGSLGEWQNFAGWHTQDGISYISVVLNVPYEADPIRPASACMRPPRADGRHLRFLHHRRRWTPPSPSPRSRWITPPSPIRSISTPRTI